MTTSMYFPGARGGLDEGSLAELAQDCSELDIHALDARTPDGRYSDGSGAQTRPWVPLTFAPIDVPDDASALIDGLAAYGS